MNGLATAEFAALGTSARVVLRGTDAGHAAALLAEELEAIDRACSRFRADSELSVVNARAGHAVHTGPLLVEALDVALRAARITDGLVDPTVGTAVRLLGYDRTFDGIDPVGPPSRARVMRVPGWRVVEVDHVRRTIRVPSGVQLDLGATAKALAADRAAARLAQELDTGVLVALGGDVAVAGPAPESGWSVGVVDDHAHPDASPRETIALSAGGLATSSTVARRGIVGSDARHHLVDPRTGRSTTGLFRTVSVAAGSCVDANIATTAAIVMGSVAPTWLTEHGLPARLVTEAGEVRHVGGWPSAQVVA